MVTELFHKGWFGFFIGTYQLGHGHTVKLRHTRNLKKGHSENLNLGGCMTNTDIKTLIVLGLVVVGIVSLILIF